MSQDKIESRRAFMKKLGKLAGAAAVAVPFMAMTTKEAVALKPYDPDRGGCTACAYQCQLGCEGGCAASCRHTCDKLQR